MYPELGKAGTPYARTVRSETKASGARPDPGLLFDCVFTRSGNDPWFLETRFEMLTQVIRKY